MSVKRYEPNVYEVLGGQYECEMSEDDLVTTFSIPTTPRLKPVTTRCGSLSISRWSAPLVATKSKQTTIDCGNSVFAVEQKYDALREAVAWEREFDDVLVWLVRTGRYQRDMASIYDLTNERECARAEVGRLLQENL